MNSYFAAIRPFGAENTGVAFGRYDQKTGTLFRELLPLCLNCKTEEVLDLFGKPLYAFLEEDPYRVTFSQNRGNVPGFDVKKNKGKPFLILMYDVCQGGTAKLIFSDNKLVAYCWTDIYRPPY